MTDFLTAWGGLKVAGFIFKPVLEELAKDATKEWVKDIFKSSLKSVLRLPVSEPLTIAAGTAIKEFLHLLQNELEQAELSEDEIKQYKESVKKFIEDKEIKETLGTAFNADCKLIDAGTFAKHWRASGLKTLPDGFNWDSVAKKFIRKAKEIRRSSEKLRAILDSESQETIERQISASTPISPEFDFKTYKETINEQYSYLKLDLLDTRGYMYHGLSLLDIFIPQNILDADKYNPRYYELPKTQQKKQSSSDSCGPEGERARRHYRRQPVRSVWKVIYNKDYRHIVILGDPGSGKSSLLKYIALQWSQRPISELPLYPLPIFIELRIYIRNLILGYCRNFLEFFHSGSGILVHLNQLELHERLKKGNVIVMFDGLDEIFDRVRRKDIALDILRFTKDYPKVKVIVTSRLFDYKFEWLGNSNFHHFILQDLLPNQIDDFIVRWHDLNFKNPEEKEIKKERLLRAIEKSPSIAELAGNPLLLTLMAILNRSWDLPSARAELYEQASRVLLELWETERDLTSDQSDFASSFDYIDYKDKRGILRNVACRMQINEQNFKDNVIHIDELERAIFNYLKNIEVTDPLKVARSLIRQLRTRNFVLCNVEQDSYAFVHRTFLEYFCASEIVSKFRRRGLPDGIGMEALKHDIFGKHWTDHSWHEVLRLIVGMIDASFAGELISFLLEQNDSENEYLNIFLAASCFSEVRKRREIASVSTKILDDLKSLVKFDFDYDYKPYSNEANFVSEIRIKAVKTIADIWAKDQDIRLWMKECALNGDDFTVSQIALQELSLKWKDHPATFQALKHLSQLGPYWTIRQTAVQELSKYWKKEIETKEIIKDRTIHDEDPAVRKTAVQELSKCYKKDPEIKKLLKTITHNDCDSAVRYAAVVSISNSFSDDPDTKVWLVENAENGKHWAVRQAALQELSKCWKQDSNILKVFKKLAQKDSSWSVRQSAVKELSFLLTKDPEVSSIIEGLMISDEHHEVRQIAIQELFRRRNDDKEVISILKTRLKADPHEAVRQSIVQELSRWLPNDFETLSIMKDLVESDKHWAVREIAIKELSRNWPESPEMLNILQNRAELDPWWSVRKTAVREIAVFFRDYPNSLDIIRKSAEDDEDLEVREAALQELSRW